MSRGLGVRQRAIMDAVACGRPVGITHPDMTEAEKVSYRRAANQLERKGLVAVRSETVAGFKRLVAYPPDAAPPEVPRVTGLDGKTYRR